MTNYDETIQQAETIIKQLEQAQALPMDEYQTQSKKAKQLLDTCEQLLGNLEKDLLV